MVNSARFRALLIALVGMSAALILMGRHTTPKPPAIYNGWGIGGSIPIFHPTQVAGFADAEAQLGFHIRRPNTCAASDANMAAIYINTVEGQAFVRYAPLSPSTGCLGYDSGFVQVVVGNPLLAGDPVPTSQDTILRLSTEAAELGGVGSVQTIAGVPAIVMQGNYQGNCLVTPLPGQVGCVPTQNNLAAVRLEYGDRQVFVYGPADWTQAQIVGVASTVG